MKIMMCELLLLMKFLIYELLLLLMTFVVCILVTDEICLGHPKSFLLSL